MNRIALCLSFSGLAATAVFAQQGVPFDGPPFAPEEHPIDNDCGIKGAGTETEKQEESTTKNSLCAHGSAARVTFASFRKLQSATEADQFDLGDGRTGAKNLVTTTDGATIGEGSVVKLAGFVIRADTANRKKDETVNCNKGGNARNDIHIHIAPTSSKAMSNFCGAVVAEMIPHLRTDDWTGANLMVADGTPLRITRQLFYDTSHRHAICATTSKQKATPRSSSWEIHPVYAIDVCKHSTLAACDPRDNSNWARFEDWLAEDVLSPFLSTRP